MEICILLVIAGIETNPGPVTDSIGIITVNCNGLTSDARLLQAIGRIKKKIKDVPHIIFIQESHNANLILLENIWKGSVTISPGSGGSKGIITLCTGDISLINFESDDGGRYLFTTFEISKNSYVNTLNLYAPNNHVISKQFFKNVLTKWDSYINFQSITLPYDHTSSSIIAGDFNCVINNTDLQNRTWTTKEKDLAESIEDLMDGRLMYDSTLRSHLGNNFTWNRGNTFSKIDYIFLSCDLLNAIVANDTIWDLVKTDHCCYLSHFKN